MKHTGIIRRIDDLGRIALPKEMQRILNVKFGDPIEIYSDPGNGCVSLKKYNSANNIAEMMAELREIIREDDFLHNKAALIEKIGEMESILQLRQEEETL